MEKPRWLFGRIFLAAFCIILVLVSFGCAFIKQRIEGGTPYEKHQRDIRARYGDPPAKGYQPLDPLTILVKDQEGCELGDTSDRNKVLLRALPSDAVRLAIGQADISGNIQFGSFTGKTKIGSYVVVLDYIKYESRSIPVIVTEQIPYWGIAQKEGPESKIAQNTQRAEYKESTPYWARLYTLEIQKEDKYLGLDSTLYNIPVYVGIGVRMTASVTVNDTSVELGSLYGLGAGAQSKKLQGTLVIQTLGLSGENISPHIPLPSEINITTIQNAIQALATIKSKLYDANAYVVPVVLAIDDNIGRPGAKEQIVSALREKAALLTLKVKGVSP
jgi:hypothetical protein